MEIKMVPDDIRNHENPQKQMTNDEAIEALRQALVLAAELGSPPAITDGIPRIPVAFDDRPMHEKVLGFRLF